MTDIERALPPDYGRLLHEIKQQVERAQVGALLAVNRELVLLYWSIGRQILRSQEQEGWGAKVIERLSQDLKSAFPEMKGFSPRNLKYMRALALAYEDESFVQQAVAQIPWGHNLRILDAVSDPQARKFYLAETVEHGWSRNVLAHQIESRLHQRQGQALSNFERTLPAPHSDLARELLKDPYNFDFLTLDTQARERELERGLLEHIRQFLLELGVGFAFVGSQVHLEVGGEDFYLDLLFYHLKLRCFVVIDLKMGAFKPEYAGKMNFYLSALDDLMRHPSDAPSLGLILCREKNRVVAEYALRDLDKPIGISGYQLAEALPDILQSSLPTVEELEAELVGKAQVETSPDDENEDSGGSAK